MPPPSPDFFLHFHGNTFHVNKRSIATKCAELAHLLQPRSGRPPTTRYDITGISADPAVFDIATAFCHGYEPDMSADNAIPLACVAHFLGMTDDHCPDNLLNRTFSFISSQVLPHWDETIVALGAAEPVIDLAVRLGIVDACLESIVQKAFANPQIITNQAGGAKRRLFCAEKPAANLTSLKLEFFVLVMTALANAGIQEEQIAICLYQYYKVREGELLQKEVVEAIVTLLPETKGVLHAKQLFELLRSALSVQASADCRHRLETRIGKQLPEATVDDLLIPSLGYAKETDHDVACILRIMEHFCADDGPASAPELEAASNLLEDYLREVATDPGLKKETFAKALGMLAAIAAPTGRRADGVYRAIDTYLEAHGHMTESERVEVCRALDPAALSPSACEHAARNERLPLRVVAQVIFVGQVRMSEAITSTLGGLDEAAGEEEIERLGSRVGELEEEYGRMRKEIERCRRCGGMRLCGSQRRKKKRGLWREVKGMLGCREGMHQCSCCSHRVHPKPN